LVHAKGTVAAIISPQDVKVNAISTVNSVRNFGEICDDVFGDMVFTPL
jgi:hypothetical protein